MWQHLASALTGSENQNFNIYIGKGSNGKSVLTKLMADVLGDYKRDVPLTLITEKRQKVGGLAPEIAELKGVRYAVMQESSKGDAVNEGVLKQLTSGTDTIQGRGLYNPAPTRFVPQFKLVMCTNELLDIRSMDGGTWRRMRVVPHVSRFTDNPDPNPAKYEFQKLSETEIKKRMTPLWKRLFVSMLVARAFVTEGVVRDCAMVTEASEAYKARQDLIGSFVAEKLADDAAAHSLKKEELSNEYKEWWSSTQDGRVSKRDELWTYMDGKYGKYCKTVGWKGVKVVYPDSSPDNDEYSVLTANRSIRL
jgi:P4 family phage/plasmid primase-like protien